MKPDGYHRDESFSNDMYSQTKQSIQSIFQTDTQKGFHRVPNLIKITVSVIKNG